MSKFKLVTFDITNTLLRFCVHPAEQYAKTAAEFGVKVNVDKLKSSFKKQWEDLNSQHPNFGAATGLKSREWWTLFVQRTFANAECSAPDTKMITIANHLIDLFATKKCWQVAEGGIELLSLLRGNHIKLGVISNFDERLFKILSDVGLYPYFDFVICSYVAKCNKPDPRIFHLALESLPQRIKPSAALHVGDNVELDFRAANNAGWNAVLLKRKEEIPWNIDRASIICDLKWLPSIVFSKE